MSVSILFHPLVLAGLICLVIKSAVARRIFALAVLFSCLVVSAHFFLGAPSENVTRIIGGYSLILGQNSLSRIIIVFVNLFGFLVCLYCLNYSSLKENRFYFSYLIWLVAAANLVCLSVDFITFIFAWGTTLAILYAMLNLGKAEAANKALVVVGLGDLCLMLGSALYIFSKGTTIMPLSSGLLLDTPFNWACFILMLAGSFAKVGCAPLHTWIAPAAESSPLPVSAILPASIDKLLGIYLLARICTDFFVLSNIAKAILLVSASITIIFAVMMALIQHDLRKLLAYHAISQVGYMVLGLVTGNIIALAGGIFHMINNALYKSGLFLVGGSVGERKGTFELDKLGALAKYMPVTFLAALVFALSISGIPPFNGFSSKWLLYQGIIMELSSASKLMSLFYVFALLSAMFASALTLASFVKFIHAIFLGEDKADQKVEEVGFNMKAAVLVLALFCLLLGLFPGAFLGKVLSRALGQDIFVFGNWMSLFAFIWILAGLLIGFILYRLFYSKALRRNAVFIGGEEPGFGPNFPATEFYRSIEETGLTKRLYNFIKLGAFDLVSMVAAFLRVAAYLAYIFIDRLINLATNLTGNIVLGASWISRRLHSGVLDFYLAWSLLGLAVLLAVIMVF